MRDDRRRPGPSTSAHAGGDEQHIGAFDHLRDAVLVFHCRVAPDLRTRSGAKSARQAAAELQLNWRGRALKRLRVGIRGDEFHAWQPFSDHMLHGVAAAPAHAYHFDNCFLRALVDDFEHDVLLFLSDC